MVSFALQLWRFLYRFNHIIDGCHACRRGFVQVNIDAFVVVQRNLEHGVEGFFHRAINTGRVQAADVMRPACIASRIKGSDFDSSKPCCGKATISHSKPA